ncbi:MAG: hypothetical protein CMP11_08115 [Zetaproteobacteria bacterium]|nr:hypothetical protein [Pseudobdellovibrionaceae bacterium]|tara:strand:- start:824 stop:1033 length:210 start_codon:yes stop_codon:yes gene_type:complete
MQKILITLGLIFLFCGLAWPQIKKLPFGQLPGDLSIKGETFSFYFPVISCLFLSALISSIFWIIEYFKK